MPTVNFFQPGSDAALEQQQIDRQRKMAELLMLQSQKPAQGQMVSGHYVAPSIIEQINGAAKGALGGFKERQADEKQKALGESLRARSAKEIGDFTTAMQGTPARSAAPLTPNDDEGNPMPAANTAAVAPDRSKALSMALQSQNPMLQTMGSQMFTQDQADARRKQMLADIMGTQAGAPGAGGAPSGAGGGLAGLDPRAIGMLLSGDAALGDVGKALMKAQEPVALREGDLVSRDPSGAVKSLYTQPKLEAGMQPVRDQRGGLLGAAAIPGYAEGAASIKGATAAATGDAAAARDMVTVDVKGVPTQMTRAQFLQMSGGGASAPATPVPTALPPGAVGNGSGPVNGQPVSRPMAPRAGDDDRTAIFSQERVAIAQRLQAAQQSGNKDEVARAQQDAIALEKEIKSNKIPLEPMPVPGVQGQSASQKEYDSTRAKDFAKRAEAIQSTASSAGGTLRNLSTLEDLFKDPQVAQGGAAEGISSLKNMAASAGIDVKGLGAEQAIAAITNKMALDSRSTAEGGGMPGAMSDADRNFLAAQQPGLSKTPEGRALIINNARKLAQRQVEIAKMASVYEQKNGRLDAGFDRELQDFANKNEMFAGQKAPQAQSAPDFRSLAAQELARRRGGK